MEKTSISFKGIDTAITSLNYRNDSVKYRFITAIRSRYINENSLSNLTAIDMDELIQSIWETGEEPEKIQKKRRNFSSLKSSINKDLEQLSPEDQNPGNITITADNVFDMTEEAKNSLLNSFTNSIQTGDININQVADILKTITEFLADVERDTEKDNEPIDLIKQIKEILGKVTKDINKDEIKAIKNTEDEFEEIDDDLETMEIDEDQEIEEIEDDMEVLEIDEDQEVEEVEDDMEVLEIDEDQEVEEIEDDMEALEIDEDQEIEEIEDDMEALEIDEDQEIEEIEDDMEALEIDEDQEVEEVEDDMEALEIDEDQEIEEIEDDMEALEIDEDQEIEEVEDDMEALEIDEDQEIEEVEDDMEALEIDEDQEIEEIEDDMEALEIDEDQEIEEVDDDMETVELDEDEEIQRLNKEEIEALEEFRRKKAMAEQFDKALSERDIKYNAYVKIPAGTYTVGSNIKPHKSLELQQIEMPETFIARYPVTNSLFEIFVEQTGYTTTAEKKGAGTVYHGRFKTTRGAALWKKTSGSVLVKGACWYQPIGPGSSLHGKRNHPVVQVSLEDAIVFTSWIGRRLPTEAEWEAGARTDMGFKYPWGNQWKENACNIEQNAVADTTPVDAYDNNANSFKIVDLLGNTMEWVADRETIETNSKESLIFNIAKGGGWIAKKDLTITSRFLFRPNFTSNTIGFRCISEKHF